MAVASSRSAVGRHPQERLLRRRISLRCTTLPPQERPRAKVSSRSAARDLLQTPLCFNGSCRKETSTTPQQKLPGGNFAPANPYFTSINSFSFPADSSSIFFVSACVNFSNSPPLSPPPPPHSPNASCFFQKPLCKFSPGFLPRSSVSKGIGTRTTFP